MATPRISSFVKKGKAKGNPIPGAKVSAQNAQLLISSGIPSLDSILGGGLPVGSLIIIDEDRYGTFAKIFMKYFLSEGVLSKQAVHVCSKDVDPESIINELPGPVDGETFDTAPDDNDEEMKIAWRYQNMKLVNSTFASQQYIGHYFNLSKTLHSSVIEKADISQWKENKCLKCDSFDKSDFGSLLQSINKHLKNGEYFISSSPKERKITRLGLLQIGSPLWIKSYEYLPIFLYSLRALLRNSFSVCMITVPFHLFQDEDLKAWCTHLSDICLKLESFPGTPHEKNVALSDYNGFFHVSKWAAINGLVNNGSTLVDLAIKLRRKKLSIEKLHLPPEMEDTVQREGFGGGGCGSSTGSLDF